MSKTWEHYDDAARHHERAAYHYKEAAKYDKAEEHEKAHTMRILPTDTINTQFIMTSKPPNFTPSSTTTSEHPLQSK